MEPTILPTEKFSLNSSVSFLVFFTVLEDGGGWLAVETS